MSSGWVFIFFVVRKTFSIDGLLGWGFGTVGVAAADGPVSVEAAAEAWRFVTLWAAGWGVAEEEAAGLATAGVTVGNVLLPANERVGKELGEAATRVGAWYEGEAVTWWAWVA